MAWALGRTGMCGSDVVIHMSHCAGRKQLEGQAMSGRCVV